MNSALMFSKASDEWATPQELFEELDREFAFVLDAAATAANTKCRRWLGPGGICDDALTAPWAALVKPCTIWLNPPYSRCREFISKAAAERLNGATTVCLVPARTDTRWWHEYVWDHSGPRPGVEVRFLRGRLKFGDAKAGAPFPSVLIVFWADAPIRGDK